MSKPKRTKPVDFGPVGLAAALHSTAAEVLSLVHGGAIRPGSLREREPRWSVAELAGMIAGLFPCDPENAELVSQRAAIVSAALSRAYLAEQEVTHAD